MFHVNLVDTSVEYLKAVLSLELRPTKTGQAMYAKPKHLTLNTVYPIQQALCLAIPKI